ncbi:hypothetical protein [Streptomyces sp. NPDC021020]|uniref:hypothetical protein n=1 Tax=Streptomyces sp. NPDC021020 TaxID=3365109 RepID=UPI003791B4DD
MLPAIARRIPLVRRPKRPALPLEERIAHLTRAAVAPAGADHHDAVARTCGVLNMSALVASDVGMPGLAAELCWRQHAAFADAGRLAGDVAAMALMPLINISRLLTRADDGASAYDVLERLHRAAVARGAAEIHGRAVDISALTTSDADHRRIVRELWLALMTDGARALARTGRWTEAAAAMAAHRGIGNRLLDGRQIKVMSLLELGPDGEARRLIDSSAAGEPWEEAVRAFLRVCCGPPGARLPDGELDHALQQVQALLDLPDPETAAFQTRAALSALELVKDPSDPRAGRLRDAATTTARLDAHAARELLSHPTSTHLSGRQKRDLHIAVARAGVGAGRLPARHERAIAAAVDRADAALRMQLAHA